jgi:hypothetical protein
MEFCGKEARLAEAFEHFEKQSPPFPERSAGSDFDEASPRSLF